MATPQKLKQQHSIETIRDIHTSLMVNGSKPLTAWLLAFSCSYSMALMPF